MRLRRTRAELHLPEDAVGAGAALWEFLRVRLPPEVPRSWLQHWSVSRRAHAAICQRLLAGRHRAGNA